MIISVDTEKDSRESILRAAKLLEELAQGVSSTPTDYSSASEEPVLEAGVMGLFDADEPPKKTESSDRIVPYE